MREAIYALWKRLAGRFTGHRKHGTPPDQAKRSRVVRERMRQVILSIPHYFRELGRIRKPSELYGWVYFKFPNSFPLAGFPPYLSVDVTNKCNFSCKHCWRTARPRPVGSMDVGLFEKIVREVNLHRSFHRAFKLASGGEPALHPHFRELMEISARYEMPTLVYTNGTLLQSFSHREILNWRLDTVVVSVDGVDADSYERFKTGGNYASLRRAVMDFYQCRRTLGCRTPVVEIRHVIVASETVTQLLQFRRVWLETADTVKFNYLEPATGLYDFEDPSRPKCRAIRREMGIWWDGTVPLCSGYRHEHLGNVRRSTISELWRHPKIEYMRQCHDRRDFAQVPVCLRCRKCN